MDLFNKFSTSPIQEQVAEKLNEYKAINDGLKEQLNLANEEISNLEEEFRSMSMQRLKDEAKRQQKELLIEEMKKEKLELENQLKSRRIISGYVNFSGKSELTANAFVENLKKVGKSSTDLGELMENEPYKSTPNKVETQISSFIHAFTEGKEADDTVTEDNKSD